MISSTNKFYYSVLLILPDISLPCYSVYVSEQISSNEANVHIAKCIFQSDCTKDFSMVASAGSSSSLFDQ